MAQIPSESPLAPDPPWSKAIGYTLQRAPLVAFAETEQRPGEPPRERDHLEELPHLRRAHQAVRLVGEGKELRTVLRRGARHHLGNAAIDEELRLAGVAGRSEEHTSELQSLTNLVCRLLLEKKK